MHNFYVNSTTLLYLFKYYMFFNYCLLMQLLIFKKLGKQIYVAIQDLHTESLLNASELQSQSNKYMIYPLNFNKKMYIKR